MKELMSGSVLWTLLGSLEYILRPRSWHHSICLGPVGLDAPVEIVTRCGDSGFDAITMRLSTERTVCNLSDLVNTNGDAEL